MEDTITLISNGKVIDGLDMWRLPQVLNSDNEAFGTRVQKILWLRLISPFAPDLGLFVFLLGIPRCLTETNEPYRHVRSCLLFSFLLCMRLNIKIESKQNKILNTSIVVSKPASTNM